MYEKYAAARDAKGMNDSQVSAATGISRSTFSDWKAKRSEPKLKKLSLIAKALGKPLEYFID